MGKTVELSGFIKVDVDNRANYRQIKLVQDDGYLIDLIFRVKEAIQAYSSEIHISFYISPFKVSKRDMIENHIKHLYGACDASYEATPYRFSSWTTGTDYDSTLKIGGHDLFNELCSYEGHFTIITLNFK